MTFSLLLITVISVGLAAGMALIAWRVVRNERRRSQARVAALTAELDDVSPEMQTFLEFDTELAARPSSSSGVPQSFGSGARQSFDPADLPDSDMFVTDRNVETHSRAQIAIAAGAVIVGAVIIGAVLLTSSQRPTSTASHAEISASNQVPLAAPERSTGAPETPVELVALGHHRDDDRLTVEGVVRNPVSGSGVPDLTAVVLMFNSAGTLVATERTPVESSDLEPGASSRFAVSAPGSDIVRYRVSFRTDEHVVPHVDKRNGL